MHDPSPLYSLCKELHYGQHFSRKQRKPQDRCYYQKRNESFYLFSNRSIKLVTFLSPSPFMIDLLHFFYIKFDFDFKLNITFYLDRWLI